MQFYNKNSNTIHAPPLLCTSDFPFKLIIWEPYGASALVDEKNWGAKERMVRVKTP